MRSAFKRRLRPDGFTIVELLIVMSIILVLAGLIFSTYPYVHKKSARSRAEAEIAAMSAALESYKADNGVYPQSSGVTEPTTATGTEGLNAREHGNPSATVYIAASKFLYGELSADRDGDRAMDSGGKSYFAFKPQMLTPTGGTGIVTALRDPFGNSYGYSTANQINTSRGYNPTFDLWSTTGETATTPDPVKWIKNW